MFMYSTALFLERANGFYDILLPNVVCLDSTEHRQPRAVHQGGTHETFQRLREEQLRSSQKVRQHHCEHFS